MHGGHSRAGMDGMDPSSCTPARRQLSLSRLNHRVPRGEDDPSRMEGTAEVPAPSVAAHLPEAAAVCDAATALGPAMDRVDPQPPLVELLVRHVLVPRELLS